MGRGNAVRATMVAAALAAGPCAAWAETPAGAAATPGATAGDATAPSRPVGKPKPAGKAKAAVEAKAAKSAKRIISAEDGEAAPGKASNAARRGPGGLTVAVFRTVQPQGGEPRSAGAVAATMDIPWQEAGARLSSVGQTEQVLPATPLGGDGRLAVSWRETMVAGPGIRGSRDGTVHEGRTIGTGDEVVVKASPGKGEPGVLKVVARSSRIEPHGNGAAQAYEVVQANQVDETFDPGAAGVGYVVVPEATDPTGRTLITYVVTRGR